MTTFLATAILGALIAVLGVLNMMGNLSSLHWYHRQRVTEENRKPFGRLVGFGTLLIGLALILFGALYLVFDLTRSELWLILGNVQLVCGSWLRS